MEKNTPTKEEQAELHKARVRAITGPAKAEGRELTPEENRALLGTIGRDITTELETAVTCRVAVMLKLRKPDFVQTMLDWFDEERMDAATRQGFSLLYAFYWSESRQGRNTEATRAALFKRDPSPEADLVRRRANRYASRLLRIVRAGCLRRGEVKGT